MSPAVGPHVPWARPHLWVRAAPLGQAPDPCPNPGTPSQALLAVGLLELRPWKPRTVGILGIVASALNCYMLFPALPTPAKASSKSPVKVA